MTVRKMWARWWNMSQQSEPDKLQELFDAMARLAALHYQPQLTINPVTREIMSIAYVWTDPEAEAAYWNLLALYNAELARTKGE